LSKLASLIVKIRVIFGAGLKDEKLIKSKLT